MTIFKNLFISLNLSPSILLIFNHFYANCDCSITIPATGIQDKFNFSKFVFLEIFLLHQFVVQDL